MRSARAAREHRIWIPEQLHTKAVGCGVSTQNLLILLLALISLTAVSGLAAVIGYGIARWANSPVLNAVGRGAITCAGTLTLGIAVLSVLVTAVR